MRLIAFSRAGICDDCIGASQATQALPQLWLNQQALTRLHRTAVVVAIVVAAQQAMPQMPDPILAFVLFFIDASNDRCAFRVVCTWWQASGERARAIIERRCAEAHTSRLRSPLYLRLLFWAPWVGVRIIRPPRALYGPARLRYDRLFELIGTLGSYAPRNGIINGIMIYMCSEASIRHKVWYNGAWETPWDIYIM